MAAGKVLQNFRSASFSGQRSNMKLNKYIVLSLLLVLCHGLNCVYCSETVKVESDKNSPSFSVPLNNNDPDGREIADDVHANDKAITSSTNEICEDSEGKVGNCKESDGYGSEETAQALGSSKDSAQDLPRSATHQDYDETTNGQTVSQSIFFPFDRTVKGYLTRIDVPAFVNHLSIDKRMKVMNLESNLFLSTLDTDGDNKISQKEYLFATSGNLRNVMTATFHRLRSENIDCIYEEDFELFSDNVEFEFLLLDLNGDDCFSFLEFEGFFHRLGLHPWETILKIAKNEDNEIGGESNVILEKDDIMNVDVTPADDALLEYEMLGEKKFASIEEAIDVLWESIDEDEDGFLSQEELVADLEWYGFEASDKVAEPLFALIDFDMDERISSDELKRFFNDLPTQNKQIKGWMNTFWQTEDVIQNPNEKHVISHHNSKWNFPLAFIIFDENKNQHIDWDELKTAMLLYRQFKADTRAETITNFMDLNKDGRVSPAEFVSAVSETYGQIEVQMDYVDEFGNVIETGISKENITDAMMLAFEKIDENEDGYLVSNELKSSLGQNLEILSEQELEELFNAVDVDKNGLISTADVHRFLTFVPKSLDGDELIDLAGFKKLVASSIRETVSDDEVTFQFASLDLNGDNTISVLEFQRLIVLYEMADASEFLLWIEETLSEKPIEIDDEFVDAFTMFDQDQNMQIDKDELKMALTKVKNRLIPSEEVDEYFLRLDMNFDNVISMTEFKILLWNRKD